MSDAYKIAKEGGRHQGFLKAHAKLPDHLLEKAARSFRRRIAEHRAWIERPETKVGQSERPEKVEDLKERKWPSDIMRLQEQLSIVRGILQERRK